MTITIPFISQVIIFIYLASFFGTYFQMKWMINHGLEFESMKVSTEKVLWIASLFPVINSILCFVFALQFIFYELKFKLIKILLHFAGKKEEKKFEEKMEEEKNHL